MKNYRTLILAAFSLMLMIGISACNKSEGPTNSSWSQYDAPEWQIPEPDNSPADIIPATLDKPFDLVPASEDLRFCDNTGMYNMKKFRERRQFMPLAKILRALELDDAQKAQVKEFMIAFRDCHKNAMLALRESEKEIIQPFNEQRRTIMEALKNGEITREEAQQQLKQLNMDLRNALQNNPARLAACEAMKECRRTLLTSIEGILTPDQLVKWLEWVSKLPEIDCTKERQ